MRELRKEQEKRWNWIFQRMSKADISLNKTAFYETLAQELQTQREEERIGFLNWAKENKHSLGELGDFVRIEYLENWCKKDFPYKRKNWVKPLKDCDCKNNIIANMCNKCRKRMANPSLSTQEAGGAMTDWNNLWKQDDDGNYVSCGEDVRQQLTAIKADQAEALTILDQAEAEHWFDMPDTTENWKTWKRIRNAITDLGGKKCQTKQ